MAVRLATLDWYPGFDHSHIYVRLLARALSCSVRESTIDEADILLVGPYGRNKELIKKRKWQTIIFGSGENMRPDYRFCDISLTLDQSTYGGKNIRIPAWAGEFDFWGDCPNATYNRAQTEQLLATNLPLSIDTLNPGLPRIAAIFSTYEQNRISVLEALEQNFDRITKLGKLWGNGEQSRDCGTLFPAKHPILKSHAMNLCFENSIAPGYVTEKILHARMAGCVALTYAHSTYKIDYNPSGVINFEDLLDVDLFIDRVRSVLSAPDTLHRMRSGPVFTVKPDPEILVMQLQNLIAAKLCRWR